MFSSMSGLSGAGWGIPTVLSVTIVRPMLWQASENSNAVQRGGFRGSVEDAVVGKQEFVNGVCWHFGFCFRPPKVKDWFICPPPDASAYMCISECIRKQKAEQNRGNHYVWFTNSYSQHISRELPRYKIDIGKDIEDAARATDCTTYKSWIFSLTSSPLDANRNLESSLVWHKGLLKSVLLAVMDRKWWPGGGDRGGCVLHVLFLFFSKIYIGYRFEAADGCIVKPFFLLS